jgi:hypothetical protein
MRLKDNPKLPAAFKRRWVEKLRSGKFKQGGGYLRGGDETHCCLGIATYCLPGGRKQWTDKAVAYEQWTEKAVAYEWRGADTAIAWAMNESDPTERRIQEALDFQAEGTSTVEHLLQKMNDGNATGKRKSFRQIADWIEKNL